MKKSEIKTNPNPSTFYFLASRFSLVVLLLSSFYFLTSNLGLAQSIPQPTITINPDIYYPLDEVLYIEGRTLPDTKVAVRFQKQGAKPLIFNVKSDVNGEWVLAEKIPMEAGDWEVRARTVVDTRASEWSNPRIFKVIVSGVTIGGINIKFAALSLLIAVLLILGVIIVVYYSFRVRRLKEVLLSKEIREAHESVREGISEIRKDVLDELHLLGSNGKALSPDELARKEHLLRDLERVEKNVEREIGDIEDKL